MHDALGINAQKGISNIYFEITENKFICNDERILQFLGGLNLYLNCKILLSLHMNLFSVISK